MLLLKRLPYLRACTPYVSVECDFRLNDFLVASDISLACRKTWVQTQYFSYEPGMPYISQSSCTCSS